MHHFKDTRILPHTSHELFDLVRDVALYPTFLPWCLGAEIHEESANHMKTTMTLGQRGVYEESFLSHVSLERPHKITVTYEKEGPFEHLHNTWTFEDVETHHCSVEFEVSFAFKSSLFNMLMHGVFEKAAQHMISAFYQRAQQLYGTDALGATDKAQSQLTKTPYSLS